MTTVITYGTFDLLHKGHIRLLERAKSLGDRLIVGVTSDQYDRLRGKLNVKQSAIERVDAVRATGLADLVIIEEYEGQKIDDIKKYKADVFTVGSDWVGKFDYLREFCEVVYLDRTKGISSTELREELSEVITMGVVAPPWLSARIKSEIRYVSGMEFVGEANLPDEEAVRALLCRSKSIFLGGSFEGRSSLVLKCLEAGCHVMVDSPGFCCVGDARESISFARQHGLVLYDAVKTLQFPAFHRLALLVKSGHIGRVLNVDACCTHIPAEFDAERAGFLESAMYTWGTVVTLPAIELLGTEWAKSTFFSTLGNGGAAVLTVGTLDYGRATATFKVGRGIKAEGSLVITGTEGYVYVPSPWWLTDYFEVRHENLKDTRKYFWPYEGEGFRYELLDFANRIAANGPNDDYKDRIIVKRAELLEAFGASVHGR